MTQPVNDRSYGMFETLRGQIDQYVVLSVGPQHREIKGTLKEVRGRSSSLDRMVVVKTENGWYGIPLYSINYIWAQGI